ncbi:B-cell receptor CD22 isoform X1 [Epinephelus lanceolatus]
MATAHLLRLLSLFTGISVLQQARSWTINVPTTITAVEGSCVVVPCKTQPHSQVTWYRYHSVIYPVVYDGHHPASVEDQFRGRTSVTGEAAEGNCTLVIDKVKSADNNLRVYVWIDPDSKSNQKFYDQTVTIIVERKTPIISIQKKIVDGEIFWVNCSVSYSCPFSPPSLQWPLSPFLKNYTVMAFNEDVKGQWSYTETLHGLATYEMHNSKMWCSAKFRAFNAESQQIPLNILYEPVTVTLILEGKMVMESGSITVECTANSNPQPHAYIWLKRETGQNKEINSPERKMTFNNITRDTSLSCIASNEIGMGKSDWLYLDVKYAPVILPESSCRQREEALECVCQAEASPNASIYLTIDGNYTLLSPFRIVSTNKKDVVSGEIRVQAQSKTNISCMATNLVGSDTKQLSVDLQTSSLSLWWLAVLLPGLVALLVGCVMFIYRQYFTDRPPSGFVCNTGIHFRPQNESDSVQQEQRYSSVQRSQDEDTQSGTNPEVDRLSCVYDNDFVQEMIRPARAQQYKNNATAPRRQGEMQLQAKSLDCSEDTYLNC